MTKNFPKLKTDTKIKIQEAKRIPSRLSSKISTPTLTTFKLQKNKDIIS